jgi:hypothetical protein
MTHGDKLRGMLSTAEGQQSVIDWLSSEMTQTMLGIAREYARPTMSPGVPAPDHSYELGRSCGAFTIVDLLSNPLAFRVNEGDGLVPDYGSDYEEEVTHGDS